MRGMTELALGNATGRRTSFLMLADTSREFRQAIRVVTMRSITNPNTMPMIRFSGGWSTVVQ
jgi:hypothetical protein